MDKQIIFCGSEELRGGKTINYFEKETFFCGGKKMKRKRRKIFGEDKFFFCGGTEEQRGEGQEENIFKKEK